MKEYTIDNSSTVKATSDEAAINSDETVETLRLFVDRVREVPIAVRLIPDELPIENRELGFNLKKAI